MPNVSDVIVERLADWGAPFICGIPGDSIDPVMEAIRTEKRIDFLQVRHEETGALIASAYAKLTGQLGACLGTAGPGAIHLLNGLYDAKLDHAPVVALTGQVDTRLLGTDYFQEVDLTRLFADVAGFNEMVAAPDSVAGLIGRACRHALAERSVAHLTIPFNVARQGANYDSVVSTAYYHRPISLPHPEDVDKAVALLDDAERVVVLAGRGAWGAVDDLTALCEALQAPVVNTLPAKGILPEDHPLSVGGLGMMGAAPGHAAMESADALLMVGTSYPCLEFLPRKINTVQIDADPVQIGKRHAVDVGLAGDARVALRQLAQRVRPKGESRWLAGLQKQRAAWWAARADEARGGPAGSINPHALAQALGEISHPHALLSVDVGNVLFWMAHNFKVRRQQLLTSAWLGTMACGLPGGLAGCLAYPGREVWAVCGDGGFTMLMGDFITAVKYDLPVKVVIFDNHKLAMIKFEQEVIGLPEFGVDLENADFAKYAEACGAKGIRVEEPADMLDALREACAHEGPVLVDARVNGDVAPLPPRIRLGQAWHYSMALFKETLA